MRFKEWFLEMRSVQHDYSSTQVNLPNPLAEEIIKWGKENIKDEDVFVDPQNPDFGREDEIHVTILYGIHSEKSQQTKELLSKENPIEIKLGKTKIFPNPNFDVLVIETFSENLKKLNKKLSNNLTYTNKYSKYQPHITIAYLKKGKGYKYAKKDNWENERVIIDYVIFSSKNGTKERINLKRRVP